jgi:type IV pilus assembly protein PilA
MVIVIIGVLAAIAIPVYLNQRNKAYDAQAKSDVRNMATAEEAWLVDNNAYTGGAGAVANLQTMGFRPSANTTLHAATANAAVSYCVQATSQSGTVWHLNTAAGQPSAPQTGPCP